MPFYVVITSQGADEHAVGEQIRSSFPEADRHEVRPGVWFVRSLLVTSAQIRDQLGIEIGRRSGIVAAVDSGRLSGVWESEFVEKLTVWGVR